jgi:hypothetical protein
VPNWGLDDIDTPPVNESAAPTRELVPEGEHAFQIREVIDGDRVEIRLVHEDRRYGWVFANLPANADWAKRILSTLRKGCGMSREEWARTPITDLVGRRVVARVYHKAVNGKTFVNVAEFKPAEPTKPFTSIEAAACGFELAIGTVGRSARIKFCAFSQSFCACASVVAARAAFIAASSLLFLYANSVEGAPST